MDVGLAIDRSWPIWTQNIMKTTTHCGFITLIIFSAMHTNLKS